MLQIKNTLGGGKPEGLYAWKKSSVSYIDNITTIDSENYILGNAKSNTTVYYSNSYTIDEATGMYTLVNPQSTILEYGRNSLYSVEMVKSNYYIWGSTSSNKIYNTNASSTYNVYIQNDKGSVYLYAQTSFSNYYKYDIHSVKTEYTFLDYIVSDKETAYPDGGEKDGYWYERVVEGAKFTTGTVTPSSGDWLRVEHGLGVTPDIITVMAESSNTSILAYALHDIKRPDYALIGNLSGSTKVVTMYRDNTSYDKSSSYGCCNETFFSLPFYQYNTSWGTSLVYRWVCISFKE